MPLERRTPLRARTGLKSKTALRSKSALKAGGRLRQVSEKRAGQLVLYTQVRRVVHARDGGVCAGGRFAAVTGVVCRGEVVCHHTEGRDGDRLLDVDRIVSLCGACHEHVHGHPVWAKSVGLLAAR